MTTDNIQPDAPDRISKLADERETYRRAWTRADHEQIRLRAALKEIVRLEDSSRGQLRLIARQALEEVQPAGVPQPEGDFLDGWTQQDWQNVRQPNG